MKADAVPEPTAPSVGPVVGSARDPGFLRAVRPMLELYCRYFRSEVRGWERVPEEGPFLVVGNHSGGQTPPPGLVEPIRGFGKVWRNDPALASRLGWALAGEQGVTLTLQSFERGVAVYVPTLNLIYVLADDGPGAPAGSWRSVAGSL